MGPLRGCRWIAGSSVHSCWIGLYEWEKARLLARTLKPGMVFFDVGANVGYFTLLASRLVGPTGRIFAFEPLRRNLTYLRRHIAMHNLENVTVVEVAVSDSEGFATFDPGSNASSGRLSQQGSVHVQTVSLDKEISAGRLPVPDILKIDVEGAEVQVLDGLKKTLETARPKVCLDIHSFLGPSFVHLDRDCKDIMAEHGYCHRQLGRHDIYAWSQ